MVPLGPVLGAWLNAWGALLVVGVIIVGMLAPLMLSFRARRLAVASMTTSAILVLIGGFLLRVVIVLSSESI
jgi:protein NrfD